ncbi:MAG: magnesium/cobalt transporter CorA [Nitrospirota bacterium]
MSVRAYAFCTGEPKGTFHVLTSLGDIKPHLNRDGVRLWIDIERPDQPEIDELSRLFPQFHPLAVEDLAHTGIRPKVEEYDDHIFIVFRGLNFNPDSHILDTIGLKMLLGKTFLVTVHREPLRSVAAVASRLEADPGLLARGPDRVCHALIDQIVDNYFPLLDQMDDTLERIEGWIFREFRREALEEIFSLKKDVTRWKREASPQREILNLLSNRSYNVIDRSVQYYFRDVYDHILRIMDALDSYRDVLSGAADSYISQVSNRMNEVMKTLSIVATIILPLSLVTGVFGMNFEVMPGLKNPTGFWELMAAMAAIAVGLFLFFRWRKWL